MIMAELSGKTRGDATSFESMEDILTSTVFQLIRYFPTKDILVPIVNSIFEQNEIIETLDSSLDWKAHYHFWPIGKIKGRELDLLIELESPPLKYAFAIEAKYYSGPSDYLEPDTNSGALIFRNQLKDEYLDLLDGNYKSKGNQIHLESRITNRYLIYLTTHGAVPRIDINNAKREYGQSQPTQIEQSQIRILWTNWSRIWAEMKNCCLNEFPYYLIKQDLIELFEKRGLQDFTGFQKQPWHNTYESFFADDTSYNWFLRLNNFINKRYRNYFLEAWFRARMPIQLVGVSSFHFYKQGGHDEG
jgi:hypothetical protein